MMLMLRFNQCSKVAALFLLFGIGFLRWASSVPSASCEFSYPLGMENGAIPDEDIWASSERNFKNNASQGRLNFNRTRLKEGSWTADKNDDSPWLSVRLSDSEPYTITGVATQGKNGKNAWVESYKLGYQEFVDDGIRYYSGEVDDEHLIFEGNSDQNTVVYHDLNPALSVVLIRFEPISWYDETSMRVEIYGCPQGNISCCISSNNSELVETPSECVNYSVFNQTDRNWNSTSLGTFCDQDVITEPGWYRFMGNAGIFMPNSCLGKGRCNTAMPGWVNGSHPSVAEGNVTRTVCFVSRPSCCHTTTEIEIRNCSGFYVYKLVEVPSCPMRYCGAHEWDINECEEGTHSCSAAQTCSNNYLSYKCKCPKGFTGENCEIDIDECTRTPAKCDLNAFCNNTYGSFTCTCNPGYQGNGKKCQDIDECEEGTHNCSPEQKCSNSLGSFSCRADQPEPDAISATIHNISKEINNPTIVDRSVKYEKVVTVKSPPDDLIVLNTTFEWRLKHAEDSDAEETIVAQGTTWWTINRRSIPIGIYRVYFSASYETKTSFSELSGSSDIEVLEASDYGFIKVIKAPLFAVIYGGTTVRWGSEVTSSVNGSFSYDGDVGFGSNSGLLFSWSCRRSDEIDFSSDCYSSFTNGANSAVVAINVARLKVKETYVLRLTVSASADGRSSFAQMNIEVESGDLPLVFLRCLVDCGPIISSSYTLRISSHCLTSPCQGAKYDWSLETLNEDEWENVPNLTNMTATTANTPSMVIKPNYLKPDTKYRLQLQVTSLLRTEGLAVLEFKTAVAPYGGHCESSVSEGVSLETEFTFECIGWQDETGSLTYEFRLNSQQISYGVSSKSASTVLPEGIPENDYRISVNIVIKNVLEVSVLQTLFVKVRPPRLGSCKVIKNDRGPSSLVLGNHGILSGFLRKLNFNRASPLALSVLNSTREGTTCGKMLSVLSKTKIVTRIIEMFTAIIPVNIPMSRSLMSVVSEAIEGKDVIYNSCNSLNQTLQLTERVLALLDAALGDLEKPFSNEMQEMAETVSRCLVSIMSATSIGSSGKNKSDSGSCSFKAIIDKAIKQLDSLIHAFSNRLLPYERLFINAPSSKIIVRSVNANEVSGLSMEEGGAQFKIPDNFEIPGLTGNILAKMMIFDINPYAYHPSSELIESSVCSLELIPEGKSTLNVSNLTEDIVITIPIISNSSDQDTTSDTFLQPYKMTIRSFYAEKEGVPVTFTIEQQRDAAVIEVFVRFGSKPSPSKFDRNYTIFLNPSCPDTSERNGDNCQPEAFNVTILPTEQRLVYFGLLYLGEKKYVDHERRKRSCLSGSREKRSCVGFKDPPPKGYNKTVVPQYDPMTDVNYKMRISQSNCLYWSVNQERWTSDGCKVGQSSKGGSLQCLCNHLTMFGGSLIQAPNPIDFDKVFVEFTRLSETGNVAVLATIICVFILYFITTVLARRADKRDQNRTAQPREIVIAKGGTYIYELVICTGVWQNSGTTANVTLSIKGEDEETEPFPLCGKDSSGVLFARGGIHGFTLITDEPFGSLTELTFTHDNSGENPSWFLEDAIIKDRQTEEKWIFPANRWLAVDKEDEQLEVSLLCESNANPASFADHVRSLAPRKLTDSHLWFSVIGKRSSSTFTRVQRASCCISLLFSAMIANAMFYNTAGESDGTIHIGPFKFSWRQVVIGVQSGLIVAPVNILIVLIFRSSKPGTKRKQTYEPHEEREHLVEEQRRETGCVLPHFCIYIGWSLCIATTLSAAAFTLFYSLMWGKELSEQWLASILTSLVQDILFLQPMKVMQAVIAISFALIMRKEKNKASSKDEESCDAFDDISILRNDDPLRLRRQYELQKIRDYKKKENKLSGMARDVALHLLFIFLMAIVCYGNKNIHRFLMSNTLRQPFGKLDSVTHPHRLWDWMKQIFVPNVYAGFWYNGEKEIHEVYFENKMSILVGVPRMRQVRIITSSCGRLGPIIENCRYDYTPKLEDRTMFSSPGWKVLPPNTSFPEALAVCPEPWRYQTPQEIKSGTVRGKYKLYEGGGFVAILGYDKETAHRVVNEASANRWVDQQTRAVMVELTVFNANTNLVSVATYFYEVLATGAAFTSARVDTLELYSTESGAQDFYLICQFLFIAMVLFYFAVILVNLYRQRLGFFTSPWNIAEALEVATSACSVVFYIIRAKCILQSIKDIQSNPYGLVSFQTSLSWEDYENMLISLAIFLATLKLLHLIRFNVSVVYLFRSFQRSISYQISYLFLFLLTLHAFAISGVMLFGPTLQMYSSYTNAFTSQIAVLLGKAFPLEEIRVENRIIGPAFAALYMLTVLILLVNMIVSILNESYTYAKTNIEDSGEDLEMAHFIGERLSEIFGREKRGTNLKKLFCDEALVVNMCRSDAEPFCQNSDVILQCTDERSKRIDKQLTMLLKLTRSQEKDSIGEDAELLKLLVQ